MGVDEDLVPQPSLHTLSFYSLLLYAAYLRFIENTALDGGKCLVHSPESYGDQISKGMSAYQMVPMPLS